VLEARSVYGGCAVTRGSRRGDRAVMKGLEVGLSDVRMKKAVKLEMQCCANDEMEMREARLSKATP
jgi:hypothetical protein